MSQKTILTIEKLTLTRNNQTFVNNLSLTINRSETIVVMGPNGCGKTTLLKAIAGIPEVPSQIIKGMNVRHSYVGHANALKAHLTIEQNLGLQTNTTHDEMRRVLMKFNICDLANRRIQTLSAGQRRQAALARLFLSKADLWIVDEPTTHLDEKATTQFWEIVRAHQASGGAAIISSHSPVSLSNSRILKLYA